MQDLHELEAIKRLKYQYFRCLDSKEWGELATTFVDEATASYDNGKYAYDGKAAIMEFLEGALGDRNIISLHMGHHPEIELESETKASGTWYLEDYVIFTEADLRLRGAGFYRDRYEKRDGRWLLTHTGYVRTFEEMLNPAEGPEWKLTHFGDHLAPSSE